MGKLSVFKVVKTVDEKGKSNLNMLESLATRHSKVSKLNWKYWVMIWLHFIREHIVPKKFNKETNK